MQAVVCHRLSEQTDTHDRDGVRMTDRDHVSPWVRAGDPLEKLAHSPPHFLHGLVSIRLARIKKAEARLQNRVRTPLIRSANFQQIARVLDVVDVDMGLNEGGGLPCA